MDPNNTAQTNPVSQQPQQPAQPVTPDPKPKTNLKMIAAIGLLVTVIVVLISSILFFDQIKSLFSKSTVPQARLGTPVPTVVCKRFTDLSEAVKNIDLVCVLDLSNQNLSVLPTDVLKLKRLVQITLNNNNFTVFPEELTTITTLLAIDMVNNQLTDVPESIAVLENLQKLDLTNNNIIPEAQNRIKKILPNTQISF